MDNKRIRELVDHHFDRMVADRRHIHRNPELSYREHETTGYILEELKQMGIPADRPLETGCVGVLEGVGGGNRVVALRADIDALAMTEEGEHKQEFLSRNEGVAHCCGHDSHTANLLGTARVLSELREEIEGTVLLVFQPGEEKLPGGGRLLCETGYLQEKGVDVIYGLHSSPHYAPGTIAVKEGPFMARPDEFEIEIIGKGGHAAYPHLAVDPIVLASQAVGQIQTIVSRSVSPTDPAVVTIGTINGGTAFNIIPERVTMRGTVRTFSQETAEMIRDRIDAILKGVTESAGARYKFDFNPGYPAVVNDARATRHLVDTAAEMIGEGEVRIMDDPIMAGEDFAFYQQHFPGAFFLLGSGHERSDSTYSWHHPRYNVDEECFRTGAALMAGLVFRPLPGED